MKILQINTVYGRGSTGKIAKGIHDACQKTGDTCITAYRYHEDKKRIPEDSMAVSSWWDCHMHNRVAKYTLLQGCFSQIRTRVFLRNVRRYTPDIIHLHNLHGSYINLKLLFSYIRKNKIPVVWTLHDCWAFTGYCPHYTIAGCDEWKTGCNRCKEYKPKVPVKHNVIGWMWRKKKSWITGIEDMILVTPSQWLNEQVQQSFLSKYRTRIIYHGIDLDVFKPTESDFRERYNIPESKHIILGVAFDWNYRKGLDVFIEMSTRLDLELYQIVLVGTNAEVDKTLPESILSIHRTTDQKELAAIYSAADLFVNPTREEMFGLVNVEANACGTPVVTFRTGGSPECIDSTSGAVVECNDVDALEKEIVRICTEKPYSREACVQRAKQFEQVERFAEYVGLYKGMTERQ